MLYTVGAALKAGSINFSIMVASRVVLGIGVSLKGGTVPIYIAETVKRRIRSNLQLAIYPRLIPVVTNRAHIGILFLPKSPQYLIHKGKKLEAFKI
ncbi:plastidic glucose transporter 4 [Cordyceps militaris]|uniref:Plastidic glucose transporter 4 n=1 Tax=Cordyceps militaris TaxID=73501 RepID=A0A2H4S6Y8_CORMI|nr:plastidic glucose transporter 4 [Cordyceps militaris]